MDLPTKVDVKQGQTKEQVAAKTSPDSNFGSYSPYGVRIFRRPIVDCVSKLSVVGRGELPMSQTNTRLTRPRTRRPLLSQPGGKEGGHGNGDKEKSRNVNTTMDDGPSSSSLGKHPRNDDEEHNVAREAEYDLERLRKMPSHVLLDELSSGLHRGYATAKALMAHAEKARETEEALRTELDKCKSDLMGHAEKARETEEALRAELDKCKSDLVAEKAENVKWRDNYLSAVNRYAKEMSTGERFHASEKGKAFLESLRKDAVKNFCESRDFEEKVEQRALTMKAPIVRECRRQLRETGLVTDKVVMMIEPHIPEVVQPEVIVKTVAKKERE